MIDSGHQLALKPGHVLEGFRIERVLGKGGFGITYLAVDLRLGKKVAIKELLPDSIATRVEGSTVLPHSSSQNDDWEWAKERFVEEARMLAGFSHPAIVGVHLLIEANGTAYMVMDYIEGESYEARLKRIGTEPDEASLMAVIGPVLEGLEQVHQRGLLHRDIKPDNILIKQDGKPVLIDFGAARESVGKTVTMTSIVTHGYSPIEQYQSKGKMGPWTDIYAVGAVICRAITGEKPSLSTDRVMEDEFVWLSHRGLNGFSERFLNAADWALRVRTEERPQAVNDWKAGLGLASEHVPTTANVAQWASQHQHPQKPRSAPANSSVPPNSGRGKTPTGKRMVVSVVAGAMGLIAAGFGIAQLMKGGVENPPVKPDVSTVDEPVAAATQTSAQAEPTPTPQPSPVAPAKPARANQGKATYDEAMKLDWSANPENEAKAKKLMRQAAEQGYAPAQFLIGQDYGSEENHNAALEWYRKAAAQEYGAAQMMLGLCHLTGLGVEQDESEATRWFEAAWPNCMRAGDAVSMRFLGLAYKEGLGMEKDLLRAEKCLQEAADNGDTVAKDMLAELRARHRGLLRFFPAQRSGMSLYSLLRYGGSISSRPIVFTLRIIGPNTPKLLRDKSCLGLSGRSGISYFAALSPRC